jgi:ABC-type microcin C transport system permease subunit YejE
MNITEKPTVPSPTATQNPLGQSAAATPLMGGPAHPPAPVPGVGNPPALDEQARPILAAFIGGLACAVILVLVSAVCQLFGWAL